jgi:hypothetical protein
MYEAFEVEAAEKEILDQAAASRTIDELKAEIATLARLESPGHAFRRNGEDPKWLKLASLLAEIFTAAAISKHAPEANAANTPGTNPPPKPRRLLRSNSQRGTQIPSG